MKLKKDYHLLFLIIIQCILILYTFYPLITHPGMYIFCDQYDGIRNYYTLKTYIEPGLHKDLMMYYDMNYPYGDYIFFTDNTPLFAVLFKLFCEYIVDISGSGIYLFNLFCLSGIIFSTILIYKILKKFVQENIIIYLFTILLPWLCPQSIRLFIGHFNLSFSWVILLTFYILLKLYEKDREKKSIRKELIWLVITVFCTSFLHLYYLPMNLFIIGIFFAGIFAYKLIQRENVIRFSIGAGICMAVSFLSVLLTINYIDTYASLRKVGAEGYNWINWKLNIPALYTAYEHITHKFLITYDRGIPYESYAYLGTATLFFLLFFFVWALFRKNRNDLKEYLYRRKEYIPLLFLLVVAAISFFISIGPYYSFMNDEYKITNYFNPFLYAGYFTERIKQFRCVGRFIWPFFWIINIAAAVLLSYLYKKNNWYKLLLAVLIIFSLSDLKDTLKNFKDHKINNLLTEKNYSGELINLVKDVPFNDYQAILTIPFYHSGSEVYEYTIDPNDPFASVSMQLADYANLPLMPAELGRTPVNHAKSFMEMFVNGEIGPELKSKLNNKPVLILVKRTFYDGREGWPQITLEPAATAFKNGLEFLTKNNCEKIKQSGDFELYRLDINKAN